VKNSDCNDNNACTVDACGEDRVCTHTFVCGDE
jgi:hypothetical protein